MPKVKVDVDDITAKVTGALPTTKDIDRFRKGVAAAAMANWKRLAQQELKSTARDYVAGIQMDDSESTTVITLTGRLPNMVEQGWTGGDMRQWLLSGPNSKMASHGGRYNVVPFRHGTPGSSGKNVGRPMPPTIHAVAKNLTATISRPGGGTQWGGRLHPGLDMGKKAKGILQSKEKPWHATSIYNGMVRQEKFYKSRAQSKYTTFRTISSFSADEERHWIHPGIQPRRLAERTTAEMGRIVGTLLKSSMGTGKK